MSIAEIQQPKYPNDRIDPRIEQALNEINRRAFVSCEREGLVVGRSIPSTETLRHIFSVLTLPQNPKVLQAGVGLGYVSAVLSLVAHKVIGIEKTRLWPMRQWRR